MVDATLFSWLMGTVIAFLLAIIAFLWNLKSSLSPLCNLAKLIESDAISKWLEDRGLIGDSGKSSQQHSLPPELAAERDNLIGLGRQRGLLPDEAERLAELLKEDARDEFGRGILSVIAFGLIMVAITAIVSALAKSK